MTPPLQISPDVWPSDLVKRDQWLTWKMEGDDGNGGGRKIPRAPFAYPNHLDRYVNAHDTDHQTSFAEATQWAETLPAHNLAYDIRDRDEHPGEDVILLDYDSVRDPETGAVHPVVQEHLDRAGTYAAVSCSGTGVHILGRLPEAPDGVQAIESPLDLGNDRAQWPNAEIEGYWSGRFVGLTGWHLEATPVALTDVSEFVAELCDEFATKTTSAPSDREPKTSREELQDVEHTTDIQDVYDAIEQTRPRDIRLRSTVTNERHGSKDLDPSWARSKSGTRLAQVDDGWIYRQGMHALDALQVVALEEGIINRESEYPSGEAFFRAVDALRDRGAHIPRLVSEDERETIEKNTTADDGLDEETILTLSGPLALRSTRKGFTYDCPACGRAVTDDHASDCDMNSVSMMTIHQAYQTTIGLLDEKNRNLSTLRADASGWGPVHTRVVEYLHDEDAIAPAGREVMA